MFVNIANTQGLLTAIILIGVSAIGLILHIMRLHRKLWDIQKELDTLTMKSEYVTMASHEVKNLSYAMATSCEYIKKGFNLLPADGSDSSASGSLNLLRLDADRLYVTSKALANFIFEILEVSRMKDLSGIPVIISRLNITNSVGDIFKIFKHQIKNSGLIVRFDRGPDQTGDVYVMADTIRVKQIMLNLIGNAIKYTERGSVNVRFSKNADFTFSLIVEDTGIGIPARDMKMIRKKYYRGSNVGDKWGTGVGLSTVFVLADSLGGEVIIDSVENVGTRIEVKLPIPGVDGEPAEA